MTIDLTFPHNYDVREGFQEPNLPVRWFPRRGSQIAEDGISIVITPAGHAPWLGVFSFGYESPSSASGVYACPDGEHLCVVAKGSAYVVPAKSPELAEAVPLLPVTSVIVALEQQLLILADYTRVCAYGQNGQAWVSAYISSDGFRTLRVLDDCLVGEAWSAPRGEWVKFRIDLSSGMV